MTDKDKLKAIHDKLVDQLVAIDNITLSLKSELTKEQRLPIVRSTKRIRSSIALLKEAIAKIE